MRTDTDAEQHRRHELERDISIEQRRGRVGGARLEQPVDDTAHSAAGDHRVTQPRALLQVWIGTDDMSAHLLAAKLSVGNKRTAMTMLTEPKQAVEKRDVERPLLTGRMHHPHVNAGCAEVQCDVHGKQLGARVVRRTPPIPAALARSAHCSTNRVN